MRNLLKPEEAATRLACSPKAVRQWLREGKLRGSRVGRLWRISEEDLAAFIAGGFAQKGARQTHRTAATKRTPPGETKLRKPRRPRPVKMLEHIAVNALPPAVSVLKDLDPAAVAGSEWVHELEKQVKELNEQVRRLRAAMGRSNVQRKREQSQQLSQRGARHHMARGRRA